ncbi:MAG: hypothetical protein M1825_004696 [Sarcosagium campestre]|nr:MAG: hypothetical protein M1825_004696 [Sarcosagium campestre]
MSALKLAVPSFLLPAWLQQPRLLNPLLRARGTSDLPTVDHPSQHSGRTKRLFLPQHHAQASNSVNLQLIRSTAAPSPLLVAIHHARHSSYPLSHHRETNPPRHLRRRDDRQFHASARHARDHHFDTLKFVQRLKSEGFSEDQAVAMMKVLSDVIEESIQNLTRTMVLREAQEKATYTQKVDFAKLRSELLAGDSTESSLTRASHDRLTNDIAKLNSRLRDEISRTQASVRLDLNLEKGRIREEANVQELKVKETETRIEQEVASLRERVEGVKFSTLQWLIFVLFPGSVSL